MIPATDRQGIGLALSRVLAEWRSAQIQCLALRGYDHLPWRVLTDLDVLVEPSQENEFERIMLDVAAGVGLRRLVRIERSAGALVSHRFFDPVSLQGLGIDVFTGLNWRGVPFLNIDTVLADRLPRSPIDIARPAHEAAASLFAKVLYGTWVKDDRRRRMREQVVGDQDEFRRVAELAFGPGLASRLTRRVLSESLDVDASETRRLRRTLVLRQSTRSPLKVIGGLCRDVQRVGRRIRKPSGLLVVLLGPDGSGKSSLSEPLADRVAQQLGGVKGHTFHSKPLRLSPAGDRRPVTRPHALRPRSPVMSSLFLIYHLAEFTAGYWLSILPRIIRGMPVVGERYYPDLWLDPLRYRLDLPAALKKRHVIPTIPPPDVALCLLADAETLQARKMEVSIDATRDQLAAIEGFAEKADFASRVDAGPPAEVVLEACERVILEWLADRDSVRNRVPARRRP